MSEFNDEKFMYRAHGGRLEIIAVLTYVDKYNDDQVVITLLFMFQYNCRLGMNKYGLSKIASNKIATYHS